jgi:endo-1,3(4)-beta-glucanase
MAPITTAVPWLALGGAALAHAAAFNTADKGSYTLFDTAISTEVPPSDLFPSNDGLQTRLPPRFLAPGIAGAKAIPTNNWWGNLIASSGDAAAASVWTNPYVVRPLTATTPYGLSVHYPYRNRFTDGSTGFGNLYYASAIATDFVMTATEFTAAAPALQVTTWDDLGVSLSFATSVTSSLKATLVPGMAFVTATYESLTPRLVVAASNVLQINGVGVASGASVTSSRFVLSLDNGQKWVVYAGASLTLTLSGTQTLVGSTTFTGFLRLALVVSDTQLAALDKSASCLLEGSNVEAQDSSVYMFHLKTSGDCAKGLFHYLQVHHMDTLDRSSAVEVSGSTAHSATRGPMTGVLTTTNPPVIRFTETQNVPVSFYPPRSPRAELVVSHKIKETLITDIDATWNVPHDGGYYFTGKALHKYANLCLMANDVAVAGADSVPLTRKCLDKLETALTPMLDNSWTYRLSYDTVYRGLISPLGILQNDLNADFGNTMYNDHHYHYGYWIAASAIVNFLDPAWPKLAQLNRMTKFLIRDVANPSSADTSFPRFRQFDWFRGHSYSHGVTAVLDGKDEESVSEDVNFHYAVALFGKATGNAALLNMGQLMLKLTTRAAQNYFLLTDDNRVHPPAIISNKVTGIMWDNKVAYMTWFSSEHYAVHGIQMIPITPVTEFVRTATFVSQEWDAILSKIPDIVNNNVKNTWLSLLYANYATVNATRALDVLQVTSLDDGLSRSWALYMAASSASVAPAPVPTTPPPTTPAPTTEPPVITVPTAAPGGNCGNDKDGAIACPSGQYCQPWNPSFYQCRSIGSASCGIQRTGIDFFGNDLTSVQVDLPEKCCDKCRSTAGCAAYTFVNYNPDGKAYCYLKSGTGTPKPATGVVSAAIVTTALAPTTAPPPPPTTTPTAAPGGNCGNDKDGAIACPSGQYCQPWNPSFYQCIPAPAQCSVQEVNVDYFGNDLETIQGILPSECCASCAATSGCLAYTFVNFNANGKSACYLKSGVTTKKTAVGVVSSTVLVPKPKCSYSANVDFFGNDLSSVGGLGSATQCCDTCAATPGCEAFTYANSICYMKKSAAGKTALNGATAGVVNR